MKPTLRTVRIAETAPLEKPRIGKTLLTGKPYAPAAAHSDPRYMAERFAYYTKLYGPKEK